MLKKYKRVLLAAAVKILGNAGVPVVLCSCLCFSAVTVYNSHSSKQNMLETTDIVKQYANTVILPEIRNRNKTDINSLLSIVKILMDPVKGIAASEIAPSSFMKFSFLAGKGHINSTNLWLLIFPKKDRETIRILHNTYMTENASGIFFGPSAEAIVKYRFAFGCSHYARVFISVVKALNIVTKPENMRYAVACESESYNEYLSAKKKQGRTINGHQFALVKLKHTWFAVNTNRIDSCVKLPAGFSPDMNLKNSNYAIHFDAIPGRTFLLRKIGRDFNDDCGDNSLANLMNIYLSGKTDNSNPAWPAYAGTE